MSASFSSLSAFPSEIFRLICSSYPRGSIFFADSLSLSGHRPEAVRWALSELSRDGVSIIRLGRGIYCYPRLDLHAKVMYPSDSDIAAALAERWRVRIAPCGAQAAFLAGLTPFQNYPLRFVSDGSEQHFDLTNGRRIEFVRRKSVKVFSFRSEILRNLVEGLRFLGEDGVKEYEVAVVRKTLREVSESDFLHDILLAPGWVRDLCLSLWKDSE